VQAARYQALGRPDILTNADAGPALIEEVAKPDQSGQSLLRDAADAMRLTARGFHRVLKVARTLADLDGQPQVGRIHLAEALSYRGVSDRPAGGRSSLTGLARGPGLAMHS